MKPAYCTISNNSLIYSVTYYRKGNRTGSLQGGPSVFKDVGNHVPLLDLRVADPEAIVEFVLHNHCPAGPFGDNKVKSLREYLREYAKQTGGTLTTLGAFRRQLKKPGHDEMFREITNTD